LRPEEGKPYQQYTPQVRSFHGFGIGRVVLSLLRHPSKKATGVSKGKRIARLADVMRFGVSLEDKRHY